jgi:AraC-like DNA-binding protein
MMTFMVKKVIHTFGTINKHIFTLNKPSEYIESFVNEYLFFDSEEDVNPQMDRFIPRIGETIVFNLREQTEVIQNDNKIILPKAIAIMQQLHSKIILPAKNFDLIIIQLKPTSLYTYFHILPQKIKARGHLDLFSLHEKEFSALFEKLSATTDKLIRIQDLNTYFTEKKQKCIVKDSSKLILMVIDKIIESKGCAPINELSSLFSVNERTLRRNFNRQIGVSVKQFSRLLKFNNIVMELIDRPSSDIMTLVERYNYFDQTHFIHDFKEILGETPSFFSKRDKTNSRIISGIK